MSFFRFGREETNDGLFQFELAITFSRIFNRRERENVGWWGETPGKLMEWQIGIVMMWGFLSVYIAFWRDRLTERKEGASIEKESRYQAKKKEKERNKPSEFHRTTQFQ